MALISTTIEGEIAWIRMNDGKANAMNRAFLEALDGAMAEASGASAVILSGRTGLFSAGLDIKTLPGLPFDELKSVLALFTRVMLRLYRQPRPVVAACTGHAIAGGAVLLLGTDEVFASEGGFKIGLNETAIGIALPSFVVEMARVRIDAPSMHRVIVEGALFSPEEAREVGLVHHVVDPERLEELALGRAKALAQLPSAYGTNKLTLREPGARAGELAFEKEIDGFLDVVRGVGQ